MFSSIHIGGTSGICGSIATVSTSSNSWYLQLSCIMLCDGSHVFKTIWKLWGNANTRHCNWSANTNLWKHSEETMQTIVCISRHCFPISRPATDVRVAYFTEARLQMKSNLNKTRNWMLEEQLLAQIRSNAQTSFKPWQIIHFRELNSRDDFKMWTFSRPVDNQTRGD